MTEPRRTNDARGRPRIVFPLVAHLAVAIHLTSTPLWAQRELRVRTLPETPLPFVTTIVAPAARHATVSDVARILTVGHRPGAPSPLTLFRLDERGQIVSSDPVKPTLPKPAALGDRPNWVLGLATHPTLPLLYVWQDVPAPPEPMTIPPALSAEFDHLLVYSLDETPPKLVFATCRGDGYHCGTDRGGFALDKAARRLYVPNMQVSGPIKKIVPAIGWIRLAPDGLPVFEESGKDATAAIGKEPASAVLDPAAAAASRATRLAAGEKAKAVGSPLVPSRHAESAAYTASVWPCPDSYAPISDESVLMASHSGAVGWNLSDHLGRFGYYLMMPNIPYRYRLAAHPTLPVAFITTVTYDGRIVRLEHADGYFTLTPQTLLLDNVVIHSQPMVLPAAGKVVVGAAGRVCAVSLTPEGRLTTQAVQMTIDNPIVEALAWSERFGRLYVPVEK